jgi:hypothetical protein
MSDPMGLLTPAPACLQYIILPAHRQEAEVWYSRETNGFTTVPSVQKYDRN